MLAKKLSKFITLLLAIFITVSCLSLTGVTNARATDGYEFDKTNVLNDLESSEDFSLEQYPFDVTGETKSEAVINFVEWCYSTTKTDDFALYVYFYNPRKLIIDTESDTNRVQMAVAYKTDTSQTENDKVITENSIPVDYDTFNVVFCNASVRSGYEGLFYKFRIVDHKSADELTIQERVSSIRRRYDISGMTLATRDGGSKDITVGGSYAFSGYAKGYGPNPSAESTLKNEKFTALETIRLEVNHTNYITDSIDSQDDTMVNSVYFAIPERYFTDYGNLQKIKAEWWEYKTKPILCVNSDEEIEDLTPYLGVSLNGEKKDDIRWSYTSPTGKKINWWSHVPVIGTIVNHIDYFSRDYYDSYNVPATTDPTCIDTLYFAFQYDDEGYISKTKIQDYIENYNKSYDSGSLNLGGKKISLDLFESSVDAGRIKGYNCHEFDSNDKFNLLDKNSGWHGFNKENYPTISFSPIESNIDYDSVNNVNVSNDALADKLLINKSDVQTFRDYYNEQQRNGNRTVLFRFANTKYHSFVKNSFEYGTTFITYSDDYVAQETVFLDFKIIQLTFKQGEQFKVIPVTQDPINIVADITPPDDFKPAPEESESLKDKILQWLKAIGLTVIGGGIMLGLVKLLVVISKIENKFWRTALFIFILIIILAIMAYLAVILIRLIR